MKPLRKSIMHANTDNDNEMLIIFILFHYNSNSNTKLFICRKCNCLGHTYTLILWERRESLIRVSLGVHIKE